MKYKNVVPTAIILAIISYVVLWLNSFPRSTSSNTYEQLTSGVCRNVLWFMGVSSSTKDMDDTYYKFVLAAINSAKVNAPSLLPHVLYRGDLTSIPETLRSLPGVSFIQHEISFASHLSKSVCPYGAFYRMDLPAVMDKIKHNLNTSQVDPNYVLYTDTDVLFYQDFNECSLPKPMVMSIGPQDDKALQGNTGVLYVNVEAYRKHSRAVIHLANRNHWSFHDCDQGLLLKYFRDGKLSTMLPARFNWKGYWGGSVAEDNITIAHFHTLKPGGCLECLLGINSKSADCFATVKNRNGCPKGHEPFWRRIPDNGTLYKALLTSFEQHFSV